MKRFLVVSVAAVFGLVQMSSAATRAEQIRQKLDSDDRTYVFVTMHRGDWRHAPENSSAAILGAIAAGADIVELDVAPTKDGHYVLLHDGALDRVSNGKGRAIDLTLAEIKQYRLKGSKPGEMTDYEVLTLEEAFQLTRGKIMVNLDKYDRDVKGITEVAIRCGVEREIVFKSGLSVPKLKKRLGESLWKEFASGRMFYMPIFSGDSESASRTLDEWQTCGIKPGAYEICFRKEQPREALDLLAAMKPPCPRIWINTLWDSLCAGHTDERGFKGDVEGSWGWCLKQGATMIQTDRPAELIKYLDSIGRHTLSVCQDHDYSRDAAFIRTYRDGALRIARRKIAEVEAARKLPKNKPVVELGPRLSMGGGFSGFFLWDSVFGVMWARHVGDLPVLSTLDNLYLLQQPDGFICREYDPQGRPCWNGCHPIALNPPILAWAEATLFREGKSDRARVERVYPALVKFHDCVRKRFRRKDGLYFGDALGCGMDDLPRFPAGMSKEERMKDGIVLSQAAVNPLKLPKWWDGWLSRKVAFYSWNRQAGWIDISAQMALDCLSLAELAEALGKDDEAAAYRAEHAELARTINERCWDEERGFYFDCTDKGPIPRYTVAAFWTLLARIPSPERAARLVKALEDPKLFGTKVPVTSLAVSDPDFNDKGYWVGASWPPTTYMTIVGLKQYGFDTLAEKIARTWYNANALVWVKEKTVRENLRSRTGAGSSGRDFCGWGALAPVALPVEMGWGE